VTTPERTDFSREESLRILGAEVMDDIARQVAAAPGPTPAQIKAIRALFEQIDAETARAKPALTQAAA
jgi:hypothetical protein